MSQLRTLKKLVLGETWVLPLGIVVVALAAGVVLRPLDREAWQHLGGFVLLLGVVLVLVTSVVRSGRKPRP